MSESFLTELPLHLQIAASNQFTKRHVIICNLLTYPNLANYLIGKTFLLAVFFDIFLVAYFLLYLSTGDILQKELVYSQH